MKLVPVIFLLFLCSLVGCSTEPEQSTPSSKADSQDRKIAKEPATESGTANTSAPVDAKPPVDTEPKKKVVVQQAEADKKSVPPPSIGYVPGADQATSSPEETAPSKTEEPAEPEPVSWLQQLRFWDMANRVIAERNMQTLKFDEDSIREFAIAIEQVNTYAERLNWLHDMLALRQQFIESKFIDGQLLASLRGEISLPKGTRERRNRLKNSVELPSVKRLNFVGTGMKQAIIENRLRKGDLYRVVINLRGSFADYVAFRKREVEQDEFLLSFPTMRLDAMKEHYCPNTTLTTVRELWAEVPANQNKQFYPDQISTSFDPRESGRTAFSVIDDAEFASIFELTNRLENMSGGPEPLLVFSEIAEFPSRKRLVEASKRNIEAIHTANIKALRDLQEHLVEQLSDRKRKSRQEDDYLDNFGQEDFDDWVNLGNLSDFGFVRLIDLAIKLKPDWKSVIKKAELDYPEKFKKFLKKRMEEVFFVGANFYFSQETK